MLEKNVCVCTRNSFGVTVINEIIIQVWCSRQVRAQFKTHLATRDRVTKAATIFKRPNFQRCNAKGQKSPLKELREERLNIYR